VCAKKRENLNTLSVPQKGKDKEEENSKTLEKKNYSKLLAYWLFIK
jgi:hypothetical protein